MIDYWDARHRWVNEFIRRYRPMALVTEDREWSLRRTAVAFWERDHEQLASRMNQSMLPGVDRTRIQWKLEPLRR